MNDNAVKIKVYSDTDDISSITGNIRRMDEFNLEVIKGDGAITDISPEEIIIARIEYLESKLISQLSELKNSGKQNIIVVNENSNALIISTLAKLGITDIFVFPHEVFKFKNHIKQIIKDSSLRITIEDAASDIYDFNHILGISDESKKVISLARKVAVNPSVNVLILGETGTGKGMLAKAIHHEGNKEPVPFVDVLSTAIPENLLESELFGYERGAFTSAKTRKQGLFEMAENGTIFLDEIGDLSLNLQAKLLRAIERKVIRRIGGIYDIPINARIIAATNRDLEKLVKQQKFRRDLYYRLNVVTIYIKPLREKKEDIIYLADHFVSEFSKRFSKSIFKIDRELKEYLENYPWPGNVRELRNAIERAVLLCQGDVLTVKYFQTPARDKLENYIIEFPDEQNKEEIQFKVNYLSTNISDLEKIYAQKVLRKFDGNKSKTARYLGVSRPKLDNLLSKDK